MTLAAIKKMTSRLSKAQKLKLAGDLLEESLPVPLKGASFEEIEDRAEEVLSGKVKTITGAESKARIDRLMVDIKRKRQTRRTQ